MRKSIVVRTERLILALLFLQLVYATAGYSQNSPKHTFTFADSVFLLDGKPFTMISGELHYPRIPREAWRHRMKMARAMGLNTIGTYVFWNLHEPEKGVFDFSGNNDIAEFVRIAKEEGLWVVIRPSPYVCAEWEFGGYPYWLQNEEGLIVRSTEPKFLQAYERYIKEVARQIAPMQINRGGNILMVQVENEYGFYSNDKEYLAINKEMFIKAGFDGLLYTCDPAGKVKDGHIPGLLPAVNGSSSPNEVKKLVREYHGGRGPFYVAEWYPAWFDWWGTPHHKVPAEDYAPKLDSLLAAGISVNMYMFHGGTTRAFMNGANDNDTAPYEPQISSYDYDAPLDEAGNVTPKFLAFRKVIENHLPKDVTLPPVPEPKKASALKPIVFNETVSLVDILPTPIANGNPLTFEDLRQAYGFVMYKTELTAAGPGYLSLKGLRDFAIVILDGKRYGMLDRRLDQDSLFLDIEKGQHKLHIVVENLGRVNFGPYLLKNKKGLTQEVKFANKTLRDWEMYSLPFNNLNDIRFSKKRESDKYAYPVLRRAVVNIKKVEDTYLDFSDWGKGVVWLNGHNLGRYWSIGPQQTVYVPAEWLKKGRNEFVIFEMIDTERSMLKSTATPILDQIPQKVQPAPSIQSAP